MMQVLKTKNIYATLNCENNYGIRSCYYLPNDYFVIANQHWSDEYDDVISSTRVIADSGKAICIYRTVNSSGKLALNAASTQYIQEGLRSFTVHHPQSRNLSPIQQIDLGKNDIYSFLYLDNHIIIGGGAINSNAIWDRASMTPPPDARREPLTLWDTNDWTYKTISELGQGIRSLHLSSDDKILCVGGLDGQIQLWDISTWTLMWEWQSERASDGKFPGVTNVQLTPDGQTVYATFSHNPHLRAFDVASCKPITVPHVESDVGQIRILKSGHLITTDGFEGLRVWNLNNNEVIAQYSPSEFDEQEVIDVETGEQCANDGMLGAVEALSLSPDGRTLTIGDTNGLVHLIELPDDL